MPNVKNLVITFPNAEILLPSAVDVALHSLRKAEMSRNQSTSGALIKCDNCYEDHLASPKPTKCVNYEGPHSAFSKQCPKYKQELEIITIKYTLNISFPEAWKRILNKPISYASISRKTTTSTATQTDNPSEHLVSTKSDIPQSKQRLPQPADVCSELCNSFKSRFL